MRLLFLFVLIPFSLQCLAQAKGGDVVLEGGINYYKTTDELAVSSNNIEAEDKLIRFNPKLALYFTDETMFGISVDYLQLSNSNQVPYLVNNRILYSTESSLENQYRYGIFISSQPTLTNRLSFRTDLGLNLIRIDGKSVISQIQNNVLNNLRYRYEGEGFGLFIQPGLIYHISKGISISGSLGGLRYENINLNYKNLSASSNDELNSKDLEFSFNPSQFLISVLFRFPEKNKQSTKTSS